MHNTREAENSLDTIFRYIVDQHYRIAIAIDEFQQVTNYPEKNIEAILRSHLQVVKNVCVIFSGSRKHILTEIFSSPERPFYNITEIMEIGSIEAGVYKKFILDKFNEGSISITGHALDRISELTRLHTFYTQYFCNRLYSEYTSIDDDDVDRALINILRENEPVYANYMNLLTAMQYRVLKAIAINDGISNPLSKEFLSKYDLGAASSVSQALKSLSDKDFVFFSEQKYHLNDVFFAHWIKYKTV